MLANQNFTSNRDKFDLRAPQIFVIFALVTEINIYLCLVILNLRHVSFVLIFMGTKTVELGKNGTWSEGSKFGMPLSYSETWIRACFMVQKLIKMNQCFLNCIHSIVSTFMCFVYLHISK